MCGICGAISLQHGYPVNRKLVYNMNRVLFHRGPDDEGYYFSNNIGMGMRRLSIIDLQTGEQPIHMRIKRYGLFLMERYTTIVNCVMN
jgi:asparagine synthase (glutamine-hydrolysing)